MLVRNSQSRQSHLVGSISGVVRTCVAQTREVPAYRSLACFRFTLSVIVTCCASHWSVFMKFAFDPRPIHAVVTTANVNDITAAKPIVNRATYVFDLGYHDYGWWPPNAALSPS